MLYVTVGRELVSIFQSAVESSGKIVPVDIYMSHLTPTYVVSGGLGRLGSNSIQGIDGK